MMLPPVKSALARMRSARRDRRRGGTLDDIRHAKALAAGATAMNVRPLMSGFQLALRAAVAAGLSIAIAQALGLQYPIYAFLAAVIVTDLLPSQSRQLGMRRLLA